MLLYWPHFGFRQLSPHGCFLLHTISYACFSFPVCPDSVADSLEFLRWIVILITGAASASFVSLNLKNYVQTTDSLILRLWLSQHSCYKWDCHSSSRYGFSPNLILMFDSCKQWCHVYILKCYKFGFYLSLLHILVVVILDSSISMLIQLPKASL